MFYLVQSINSALKPLETEAVDARLGKNTKNSDVMDDDHPGDDKADFVTDINAKEDTSLLIKSIILILEDYLEERLTSAVYDSNNNETQISFPPWFSKNQSNDIGGMTTSKEAIRAYAHAAETSIKVDKPQFPKELDLQLNAIYSLIKSLRVLKDNGVEYLQIDGEKTLIRGIEMAVNKMNLVDF